MGLEGASNIRRELPGHALLHCANEIDNPYATKSLASDRCFSMGGSHIMYAVNR
jgi:hypothetical protein